MPNRSIYAHYCQEFTKLSVWYARKRILEGSSDFDNAFNERVNIFRNTQFYNDHGHPANGDLFPEWNALLDRVQAIFDQHIHAADTSALEQKCLDVFWPSLKERADTIGDPLPDLAQRPYESWSYDYRGDECLNIHIANTYRPASPLSEKRNDFAACLIRLLKDSQARRPEITVVACGSWLNSAPAFGALFTQAWHDSAEPSPNVRYTMGHWGQFMDRRGDFHAGNGQRFRTLGRFPHPCLRCQDKIQLVLDHLTLHFPQAVAINERRDYPGWSLKNECRRRPCRRRPHTSPLPLGCPKVSLARGCAT
jgi:hypothetical protein